MPLTREKEVDLILRGREFGICENVEECIENAKKAFEIYRDTSFLLRKKIISCIRAVLTEYVEYLSRMAVEETGLGRVEDKIAKNMLVIEKTPGAEGRQYVPNSAYMGDYGVTFLNGAPYGVIGAVTPSTNPAATIINNSITMLSAGNTIVFNTHPGAKNVSNAAVMLVNQAVLEAGCRTKLVFSTRNPTVESSQQLMRHPDVKLLVVTGGPDVVRTAMASGKKVIAAGPGNPPVIVDETAVIEKAA
jgi:acyl-CoA reductase-like NAD-dependent aldehyde dehydrogenase